MHLLVDIFGVAELTGEFMPLLLSKRGCVTLSRCVVASCRGGTEDRPSLFSTVILSGNRALQGVAVLAEGDTRSEAAAEEKGDAMEEADDALLPPTALPSSVSDPRSSAYLLNPDKIPVNTDSSIAFDKDLSAAKVPFVLMPEESLRRVSANAIRVISGICQFRPTFLQEEPEVLLALKTVLYTIIKNNGFTVEGGCIGDPLRQSRGIGTSTCDKTRDFVEAIDCQFQEHHEINVICETLLTYYSLNYHDILSQLDLIPVLCIASTVDFSFITNYFKFTLPARQSLSEKKQAVHTFLAILDNRSICPELKVKVLQVRGDMGTFCMN